MTSKIIVFCATALFMKSAFGQFVSTTSALTGNVMANNINLGPAGVSYVNGGPNLANIGVSLANDGLAFGGPNVIASPGAIGINGFPALNIPSSGPFVVTSISPIGPSGLAVASENVIEGVLSVAGQLPYLSAVAFEGTLPTAGSGIATCGCGSGSVGIVSEGFPAGPANNLPRRNFNV